ncbi:unnamed protein product, partial [Sphacelaria rigidula]
MCLDSTHQVQSPSSIPLDSHYHDASAATTKHTARLLPVISPPLSLKASSRQPPMPCLIVEQTPAPVSFSMTCPTRHEKNTSAALTTVTGGAGTPPEGSASGRRPTLVLVSKYPTPGSSKTRLIPAFGKMLAARLAMAMLKDLLARFAEEDSTRVFRKVFVYAPASAGPAVAAMLKNLKLDKVWEAEPVVMGTALRESGLTNILESALANARSTERDGAVVFVGMDTPELPWSEVMAAKNAAEMENNAYICPASDGGYTLLGLPSTAREGSFEGVLWSDPRTCASQAMVLSSKQVPTRYGG